MWGHMQLANEAQAAISQLVGMLKPPAVYELPGTVAVVTFRAATAVATQRAPHMGRILPTLLAVANGSCKQGGPSC